MENFLLSRDNEHGNHMELKLSRKDKIWVAVAIIAIIVGFVFAVVYDL